MTVPSYCLQERLLSRLCPSRLELRHGFDVAQTFVSETPVHEQTVQFRIGKGGVTTWGAGGWIICALLALVLF